MNSTTLDISGMTCAHCVMHVTEELKALDGVKDVKIDLHPGEISTAMVVSENPLDDAALREALDEAGDYKLEGVVRA